MEIQITQPNKLSREIKNLRECIAEDIPREKFDVDRFLEKYSSSVNPEALRDTLEEVLEKGHSEYPWIPNSPKNLGALAEQALKRYASVYPLRSQGGKVPSTESQPPEAPVKAESSTPQDQIALPGNITPPQPVPTDTIEDESQGGNATVPLAGSLKAPEPEQTPSPADSSEPKQEPTEQNTPVPPPHQEQKTGNEGAEIDFIPGGAFLVARKIFLSGAWTKDPLYFKVWLWIIGEARYEAQAMKGIQCERGEFVTTYNDIMKAASYYYNRAPIVPTVKQVRDILEWFEAQKMILVEPIEEKSSFLTGAHTGAHPGERTGAYTGIKITVLNYIHYQNPEAYRGRPQRGNRGTHFSQQGHTISNKDNKELNNTSYCKKPSGFCQPKKHDSEKQQSGGEKEVASMLPGGGLPESGASPVENESNASAALPRSQPPATASESQSASATADSLQLPAAHRGTVPESTGAGTQEPGVALQTAEVGGAPGELSGIGKKGKAKPAPDPRVRPLIGYFCECYKAEVGKPYKVDGGKDGGKGKDGALIKKIPSDYSIEQLKELVDFYFAINDDFILKAGYSIGMFYHQFNKLVQRLSEEKQCQRIEQEFEEKCRTIERVLSGPTRKEFFELVHMKADDATFLARFGLDAKGLGHVRADLEMNHYAKRDSEGHYYLTDHGLRMIRRLPSSPPPAFPRSDNAGPHKAKEEVKRDSPKGSIEEAPEPARKPKGEPVKPVGRSWNALPQLEEAEIKKTMEWFKLNAVSTLAGIVQVTQEQIEQAIESQYQIETKPTSHEELLMWLTESSLARRFGETDVGGIDCPPGLDERAEEQVNYAYRKAHPQPGEIFIV